MEVWKLFLSDKKNARQFYVVLFSLVFILFLFLNFLTYNEGRTGYAFNDPVMSFFSPRELSVTIFLLTYGLSLAGIVIALKKPEILLSLLGSYVIMTIIRMICLYLLPLEPPAGIIPLKDVFLRSSFYSGRENLRDLFFSGHTATIFLFAFVFNNKRDRVVFAFGGFVIGMLLIIQHVHYSIDVIAAPVFAYASVRILRYFKKISRQPEAEVF